MVQSTYPANFIISGARYPWLGNYRGRDTEEVDVYEKYQEWNGWSACYIQVNWFAINKRTIYIRFVIAGNISLNTLILISCIGMDCKLT